MPNPRSWMREMHSPVAVATALSISSWVMRSPIYRSRKKATARHDCQAVAMKGALRPKSHLHASELHLFAPDDELTRQQVQRCVRIDRLPPKPADELVHHEPGRNVGRVN